jgi:hypothetical protein
LKNPSQKRVGGVAQDAGPEFKSKYCKKILKVGVETGVSARMLTATKRKTSPSVHGGTDGHTQHGHPWNITQP